MGIATHLTANDRTSESGAAHRTYRLDPPLDGSEYVVVSAVVALYSGPETYIFPADETGHITGYGELDGSYRGGLSHETALRDAGYDQIVEKPVVVQS